MAGQTLIGRLGNTPQNDRIVILHGDFEIGASFQLKPLAKGRRQDKAVTERFGEGLTIFGAKLFDLVIIGAGGRYFSVAEQGLIV